MRTKTALKVILIISIVGMIFSGYLMMPEFINKCLGLDGCSIFVSQEIFGLSVWFYAFIMYLLLFIFSIVGLRSKK